MQCDASLPITLALSRLYYPTLLVVNTLIKKGSINAVRYTSDSVNLVLVKIDISVDGAGICYPRVLVGSFSPLLLLYMLILDLS